MTTGEQDLMVLLAAGIGLQSKASLSDSPDWEGIYRLAEQHAVLGILAEACPPEAPIAEKLFEDSMEIARRNKRVNELLARVFRHLESQGVTPVLQKGQGLARHYPNPMMRMSGDIDLLVPEEEYDRAKELLSPIASDYEPEHGQDKHCLFRFGDLEVEIHATEFWERKNGTWEHYREWCRELFAQEAFDYYPCEGVNIRVAQRQWDIFYTFLHLVKHYYYEGVGLRQLLDLRIIVEKEDEAGQGEELLLRWVREFGLMPEWQGFSRLSLTADSLLLRLVLNQGNMGRLEKTYYSQSYLMRLALMVRFDFTYALRHWPFSRKRAIHQYGQRICRSFNEFYNHRIRK